MKEIVLPTSQFLLATWLLVCYWGAEIDDFVSVLFKWLYYSAWYGAVASYVCLWLKYAQTKRVWIYRLLFLMLFCGFNAVMLFIVRM